MLPMRLGVHSMESERSRTKSIARSRAVPASTLGGTRASNDSNEPVPCEMRCRRCSIGRVGESGPRRSPAQATARALPRLGPAVPQEPPRRYLFRPWWVPRGRLAQANSSPGESVREPGLPTAWQPATLKEWCCRIRAGEHRFHTARGEMDAQEGDRIQ